MIQNCDAARNACARDVLEFVCRIHVGELGRAWHMLGADTRHAHVVLLA